MSLEAQFITSFRMTEKDPPDPGLYQNDDGTISIVNPDGSVSQIGGSTDEIVTFAHVDGAPEPVPMAIVAVDVDAQTLAVAGDQTRDGNLLAAVPNGAAMTIAGSTGNDGPYIPSSTSYDPVTDRTTYVLDTAAEGSLSSPIADGTLQLPIIWTADVPIPPNGAVEWVLIQTTEAWTFPFYGVIGDEDDPEGFCAGAGSNTSGGLDVGGVGRWQWPLNTVNAASASPVVIIGKFPGIKFYPDGARIRIVWPEPLGGSAGRTIVVVHHHYTDPVTPTRIPAAA